MAFSGRNIRISRDGAVLVGARSDGVTIDMTPVDITDKDSGGWRVLLNDVGVRSVSGEVEGIIKDAVLIGQAMAGNDLLIDAGECDIDGIALVTGNWHLGNVVITGAQEDSITFTATLESSGSLTTTTAPYCTVLPAVTGTVEDGETLTRTQGTWAGTATITYATQWQAGPTNDPNDPRWSNISGATGATRVLATGQVGQYVRARVRATNSVGTFDAYSNIVGPVAA